VDDHELDRDVTPDVHTPSPPRREGAGRSYVLTAVVEPAGEQGPTQNTPQAWPVVRAASIDTPAQQNCRLGAVTHLSAWMTVGVQICRFGCVVGPSVIHMALEDGACQTRFL
jgi:hypothetical protein